MTTRPPSAAAEGEIGDRLARIERLLEQLLARRRAGERSGPTRAAKVARRAVAEVRTAPDEMTRARARQILRHKGLAR